MSSPAERCGGSRIRCKISVLAGDTPTTKGFTLIEIVTVMALIVILAASVLGITGYVQEKGKRSRAEVEIAAMSAALETYKADNGIYPSTDNTIALTSAETNPVNYSTASLDLYKQLSGDQDADGTTDVGVKSYFDFKPQMLNRNKDVNGNLTNVTSLKDPFGNCYGYSTSKNPISNPNAANATGNNPTFDLWSAGPPPLNPTKWIKNW